MGDFLYKRVAGIIPEDTESALACLKDIPISIHCWQGDDVIGLDGGGSLSGGIQTTGNYPGRARNFEELKADIKKASFFIRTKPSLPSLMANQRLPPRTFRSLGGFCQGIRLVGQHKEGTRHTQPAALSVVRKLIYRIERLVGLKKAFVCSDPDLVKFKVTDKVLAVG